MRKFLSLLVVVVCLFGVIPPQTSSVLAANDSNMEEDYKELMSVIKSKVLDGWSEEEIGKLPIVSDFKNKYSEEQIARFLNSKVEVYNQDKVEKKLSETKIHSNGNQLIEFEDGSFIYIKGSIKKLNQDNSEPVAIEDNVALPASKMYSTQGKSGDKFSVNNTVEFWGIYLAARAVLNTDFTIYTNKITVNRAHTGGSKGIYPTTLQIHGTNISSNNTKTPSTDGSFTKVNGVVIGGQPIGFSHTFTLITDIRLLKVSDNGAIVVGYTNSSVQ